jgi:hypothetical protein
VAVDPANDFVNIKITGLSRAQAVAISAKKGFWGKLWDELRKLAKAATDLVTVDVGGAKCWPDVKVALTPAGKPESMLLGGLYELIC